MDGQQEAEYLDFIKRIDGKKRIMINDKNNLVPNNTIAVVPTGNFDLSELHTFIKPLKGEKKRGHQ
jgi:hypothetical protein